MAHSKNFFSNRSGSTSTHTYSNVRGEQITKDRQPVPANPRTVAQLRQRMIVRLCQNAARELRPIISQSFDNVPNGSASVREFLRINQKKGSLDVVSWAKKDSNSMFFADFQICNSSINNYNRPLLNIKRSIYDLSLQPEVVLSQNDFNNFKAESLILLFSKLTGGMQVSDIYFFFGETKSKSEDDYNIFNKIVCLNTDNLKNFEVKDIDSAYYISNPNYPIGIEIDFYHSSKGDVRIYYSGFNLTNPSNYLSYANLMLRIYHKGKYKFLTFGWEISDYLKKISFEEALQTYL